MLFLGAYDYPDVFPQSIVNSSYTILHSIALIYALAGLCISSTPYALA